MYCTELNPTQNTEELHFILKQGACTRLGQEGQCWCRGQIAEIFYLHNRVFLGGRVGEGGVT